MQDLPKNFVMPSESDIDDTLVKWVCAKLTLRLLCAEAGDDQYVTTQAPKTLKTCVIATSSDKTTFTTVESVVNETSSQECS